MKEIKCLVANKGDITNSKDERITFIPSGYENSWIKITENYTYGTIYSTYAEGKDLEFLNKTLVDGKHWCDVCDVVEGKEHKSSCSVGSGIFRQKDVGEQVLEKLVNSRLNLFKY